MLGDHGLLFKGGYMYDEVLHVPLILRAPGRVPAGRVVEGLVEEVDLCPTLLELLGVAAPPGVQGRSLFAPRKEAVFAEFPTIKCARTREWKLVHYPRQKYGELYDLRNDPQELYNLWGDGQYAARRADMLGLLADFFVSTQDPLLAPVERRP